MVTLVSATGLGGSCLVLTEFVRPSAVQCVAMEGELSAQLIFLTASPRQKHHCERRDEAASPVTPATFLRPDDTHSQGASPWLHNIAFLEEHSAVWSPDEHQHLTPPITRTSFLHGHSSDRRLSLHDVAFIAEDLELEESSTDMQSLLLSTSSFLGHNSLVKESSFSDTSGEPRIVHIVPSTLTFTVDYAASMRCHARERVPTYVPAIRSPSARRLTKVSSAKTTRTAKLGRQLSRLRRRFVNLWTTLVGVNKNSQKHPLQSSASPCPSSRQDII